MADGVARAFLQDAKCDFLDRCRKALVLDIDPERDLRPSRPPEGNELLNRMRQTLIDQQRRSQPAQDAAQMQLHVLDGLPDGFAATDDVVAGLTRDQERNGLRIDIDGKQERADLVVQIAGNLGTLFFLHRRQLLVEPLVLLLGHPELLCHAIEGAVDGPEILWARFGNVCRVVALADAVQGRRFREAIII